MIARSALAQLFRSRWDREFESVFLHVGRKAGAYDTALVAAQGADLVPGVAVPKPRHAVPGGGQDAARLGGNAGA